MVSLAAFLFVCWIGYKIVAALLGSAPVQRVAVAAYEAYIPDELLYVARMAHREEVFYGNITPIREFLERGRNPDTGRPWTLEDFNRKFQGDNSFAKAWLFMICHSLKITPEKLHETCRYRLINKRLDEFMSPRRCA